MKQLLLSMTVALVITGCATSDFEEKGTEFAEIMSSCEENGGLWLSGEKECLYSTANWCDEAGGYYGETKGCGTLKKYESGPCTLDIKFSCGFDFPYE